jgi:Carboxypeptidase regulatory-like domain/TonB dependent receptor
MRGQMAGRRGLFAVVGILWAVAAAAQYNTAEIAGVVSDAQGGSLPGATVTALHVASGARVVRSADSAGRFFLPALPAGEYVLTIELRGFKPLTRTGLMLAAGEKLNLPVTLDVGPVSESITVTLDAPALQTATTEVSDVISNRQVVQLPLNGRMFLQLAQLTDGIAIPPGGTRGAALEQAGSLPAVYGQRSGHNIYLIDGVKVTDEFFNNLVISPSIDAIREFKIQKTMYPAEFGGKSSALVNVVTRSGENVFHGSMVEFARHDALDARNYFDDPTQPVPPLRQHQFGASLGGPIARDRTFFFASYEGQRVQRSVTRTFSVPTGSLRAGDFSGLPPVCDPLSRRADGSCTPFAGNQIPAGRLDPIASALLAQVPLPTRNGLVQNLLAVGNQTGPTDQFSVRVDHRLSDEDRLFGRFTTYDVSDDQPFGTSSLNETLVPGFGRIVTTRSRNLALGSTHVFGPHWVNELRAGFLTAGGGQVSPNQGVNFAGATGLQGVSTDPRDAGYPQVSFGGLFSTIGDPTSFVSREDRSYELYDNVIADRGDHQFKFGGYLFHLDFNPVNPNQARGAFTYSGQWTGNAFADFLLGYPSSAQVGLGRADEHGRSTWLHVYAQDDWRVRPNLTLNYGLRYEVNGQMTDGDNRLSAIDLTVPGGRFVVASDESGRMSSSADALLPQMPIPYVTSQAAGWTNGLLRPSYLRFAPRVGAAWSLDNETVVHASFGVFLNQWAYSVQQAFAQTLPFFFAKTVNAAADAIQPASTTATILVAPSNGTIGGSTMNHDFQTEYAKNYAVSMQRTLGGATVVEVGFLRSTVIGADSSTVLNVPAPGPGPIAPRRPVPQLANITAIRWDGYSIYNGLTVRLERRTVRGLAFSANYTLSKAVDDASDPGATASEANLPQDVRNMAAEEAVSSFDHRHRFVGNFTYALGAGFQVTGIVTLQSGAPFTVNIGTDRANIGSGPAQRPDAVCDPNAGGARTAEQWFNTACFALPAPFTFGNAARNSVVGPGYADVDAALQKDIELAGRLRLQLRWEVFNLLNHPNFDIPNRTAFTANFGRIFSAQPSRQMQIGARVTF